MNIKAFEFSLFGVNTYVVWNPETNEAAIIDPAMTNKAECEALDRFIAEKGLHPVHLINTHLHLDHTFGDEYVSARYGLPLEANEADAGLGANRQQQADKFRLPIKLPPVGINRNLREGDKVKVGTDTLAVLNVPGHSPGSIALYNDRDSFVITGDALFRGSIGRTDLTGGNHAQLIGSITDKLLTLPPYTRVYPGHGPSSTIIDEQRSNPYI